MSNLIGGFFPSRFVPSWLLTWTPSKFSRVRVDVAQTSFFTGNQARTFKELSIASGSKYTVKVVVPIDAILLGLSVNLDAGSVRLKTIAKSTGTEGGIFSETLPTIRKNNMISRVLPYYDPVIVISAGGTITGGLTIDTLRVVAAGATAQQSTIGADVADERGIAPGTYYFEFENIGNNTATGVFRFFWEERP